MMSGHAVHRTKIRLWQTLSVLSRFVGGPEERPGRLREDLIRKAWASIHFDHLPSGRVFVEAFLSKVLLTEPRYIEEIFLPLLGDSLVRTQVSVSLLVVAGQLLVNTDSEKTFSTVLQSVLPYIAAQNHAVRALAQLAAYQALHVVFGPPVEGAAAKVMLSEEGKAWLRPLHAYLTTNKDCVKVRKSMQMPPEAYDPVTLCSPHRIFCAYPDDHPESTGERIPSALLDLVNAEIRGRRSLNGGLRDGISDGEAPAPADRAPEGEETAVFDFQKKITPWEHSLEEGSTQGGSARDLHLGREHQELIVVASLIDKAPNLAGLCRTCEIFNASAIALANKKVLQDSLFKQVSVTAEKWLPILEVKVDALAAFLNEKKMEGWHLVGLEQTANSQSILDYAFPRKTVLLLGEEQRGIPADYIHLLDECVEIPQLGVIRSLNVHVSASICVWEYTKAHQFGKSGA